METPVLKNSRDLWNLVCDVCAKSCPKAAYFRVWIEMDFILDDIWIVTSRSRWVPTWRTSWFRMVRRADENYPSWGINYDEPSMTTPSSHVEVANSPWPARSNVPNWVKRIISARFFELFVRSELSFFEKKTVLIEQYWTVGWCVAGETNTQIPRFQSIPLGSNPSGQCSIITGSWDLSFVHPIRRDDFGPRAKNKQNLIRGNYREKWKNMKNMKKYRVSCLIFFMYHVGFEHRIISWFSFCFWLVFEVNSTASRRGGLGLSAVVQLYLLQLRQWAASEWTKQDGCFERCWLYGLCAYGLMVHFQLSQWNHWLCIQLWHGCYQQQQEQRIATPR